MGHDVGLSDALPSLPFDNGSISNGTTCSLAVVVSFIALALSTASALAEQGVVCGARGGCRTVNLKPGCHIEGGGVWRLFQGGLLAEGQVNQGRERRSAQRALNLSASGHGTDPTFVWFSLQTICSRTLQRALIVERWRALRRRDVMNCVAVPLVASTPRNLHQSDLARASGT
jgi:hypothetical protein